jgi:hypothetical protein
MQIIIASKCRIFLDNLNKDLGLMGYDMIPTLKFCT